MRDFTKKDQVEPTLQVKTEEDVKQEIKEPPIPPPTSNTTVSENAVVEEDTSKDHKTLITPINQGEFNFMVDCTCHWQGRAKDIKEANDLAQRHKMSRKAWREPTKTVKVSKKIPS